jgi:Family of unknown function (DUF5677)
MLYEKYREHFDYFLRLHQLAEQSLLNYKGISSNHFRGALVLIFPRAYKSFDSIRRLCEVALCEDAAVILRSLLNLLVVTRWIALKPDSRAKKYFAWYWVEMQRQVEKSKDRLSAAQIEDIQRHFNAAKSQFEYTDRKGRLTMAKQWYQPEAHSIVDLFAEVGLQQQYDDGYKVLSGIEHSDAMAYFAMLEDSEKSENEQKIAVQSDLFIPAYLRNSFQYFANIFRICNQGMSLVDKDELEEIIAPGMKFFEADLQAGRIRTG